MNIKLQYFFLVCSLLVFNECKLENESLNMIGYEHPQEIELALFEDNYLEFDFIKKSTYASENFDARVLDLSNEHILNVLPSIGIPIWKAGAFGIQADNKNKIVGRFYSIVPTSLQGSRFDGALIYLKENENSDYIYLGYLSFLDEESTYIHLYFNVINDLETHLGGTFSDSGIEIYEEGDYTKDCVATYIITRNCHYVGTNLDPQAYGPVCTEYFTSGIRITCDHGAPFVPSTAFTLPAGSAGPVGNRDPIYFDVFSHIGNHLLCSTWDFRLTDWTQLGYVNQVVNGMNLRIYHLTRDGSGITRIEEIRDVDFHFQFVVQVNLDPSTLSFKRCMAQAVNTAIHATENSYSGPHAFLRDPVSQQYVIPNSAIVHEFKLNLKTMFDLLGCGGHHFNSSVQAGEGPFVNNNSVARVVNADLGTLWTFESSCGL